jgi:hypothetical protein
MSPPNLGALRAVAERLDGLGMEYAFLGGSIVTLLLDSPELSPARPTDDMDVIIEVATTLRYSDVEAKLRDLKFDHTRDRCARIPTPGIACRRSPSP